MESIELIRENLERSEEIVLSRIEDMREHCFVFPSPRGGCHTLWVLGHLTYIESLVIDVFMVDGQHPRSDWQAVFDGGEPSGIASEYPAFDLVLDACRQTRAATISLLDVFVEADLDRPSQNAPSTAVHLFGTYRRCFQYVADHWYMHRGQLADARRAAGVEKMWF